MDTQQAGAVVDDEPSLAQQARQGDEAAFETLVRRYQRRLLAYCRRMTGPAGPTEDLAQEVFVKLYLALPTVDPQRPIRAFLFRIAHNHCLDWLRKRRVATVPLAYPDDEDGHERDPLDAAPSPEDLVRREEVGAAVDRALARVPEAYRSVLIMRHQADLAYEEIASALSIPIGTVKARLHRGRAHLQQSLRGIV
jgi:RNA polymerase sigma-70 factor (ECF subfamily)